MPLVASPVQAAADHLVAPGATRKLSTRRVVSTAFVPLTGLVLLTEKGWLAAVAVKTTETVRKGWVKVLVAASTGVTRKLREAPPTETEPLGPWLKRALVLKVRR